MLAVHGITAHGYWWLPLARELSARRARIRLFAACLRGRADSRDVGPPFGLARHAADLVEVSAHLGVSPLLLGHSMGAFVAAVAAAGAPGVFPAGAVLVDGGVPVPLPDGMDPQAAAREVLRPAARRLRRQFVTDDAYVASWASHPGLRPVLRDVDPGLLRDIALHDAVTDRDGRLRCGVAEDAVAVDACDVAVAEPADEALTAALARGVPVELVWARRGLMNEPHGLYDDDCVAGWARAGLVSTRVEGANHLSVVLVDPGVRVIADVLERRAANDGHA